MGSSHSKHHMSLSERLYRLLLVSYPIEFRQVYSQEMLQTFRDYRREIMQESGKWGVVRLWGFILYDLATTVVIEYVREFKRFLTGRENISLVTQFSLNVAQHTDIGRQRKINEDSMISIIPADPQVRVKKGALFVVADGMGGHTAGDVASEMAVNAVRDAYYANENDEVGTSLLQAMKQSNTAIYQANESKKSLSEKNKLMGTTCVAAVLIGDTVYVANVGDSRAYIVRGDRVKQISQDHSVVAEEIRAGLLTPDQARGHPQSNVIYRCFGEKADVEVDLFSEPVQDGDLLVLCTDGLSNLVSDEELQEIVQQFGPQESVYQLVERANDHGGSDNITAMVIQVSLEQNKELSNGDDENPS